jgi:hypothetical protein
MYGEELQISWGKKNTYYDIFTIIAQMSFNVPAVTDVLLRPIRKNAQHFYGRKKNVAEQNTKKGRSPDWCFV